MFIYRHASPCNVTKMHVIFACNRFKLTYQGICFFNMKDENKMKDATDGMLSNFV